MDDSVQLKLIREDLDAIVERLHSLEAIEKRVKGMAEWVALIGIVTMAAVGLTVCFGVYMLFLTP